MMKPCAMRLNSWVMSVSSVKWVQLGEYIELCNERNCEGKYSLEDAMGMTITKEVIPTKANLKDNDLSKFWVVKSQEFVYNPRTHGKKIGLGYNNTGKPFIISWNNIAFRVKDVSKLLPDYLYIIVCREEWDRNACFRSWGSSTEVFSWNEFTLMEIPLPDIKVQQELVDTYKGLKALAEQNEALIEPLSKACEAFIVDCKTKYPEVELGEYIEEFDRRNSDNAIKLVKSVSVTKEFKETNAKVNKDELSGYKLVPPYHIAYVQTTKNEKCFANALNTSSDIYVVSQVDRVIFSRDPKVLDIRFLHLIFRSKEFDRYAIFNSWGSARETFDYSELCRTRIPLPPIEEQRSIADLYNCLEEAKKIASEAREKLKTLCPALVQRAANS